MATRPTPPAKSSPSRSGSANLTPREAKRQAEIKQKAAAAAEKARKKASTDPADMGRIKQIRQAYSLTKEHDPQLPYLMLAGFLVPVLLGVGGGLLTGRVILIVEFALLGVLTGLVVSLFLLTRRAKRASFKRYAGQAGSAEVALNMLPKQWSSSPAIAATRQLDVVHRTVGPGGLVLIAEGEPSRVRTLLTAEAKKHQRINDRLTVTTVMMGDGQGQVPLDKLTDHIRKLPKVMQPHEITDLKSRLTALDAVRPRMPMPKGPMPTSARQVRGSKQALRGR